jgi:hypothetical protein
MGFGQWGIGTHTSGHVQRRAISFSLNESPEKIRERDNNMHYVVGPWTRVTRGRRRTHELFYIVFLIKNLL